MKKNKLSVVGKTFEGKPIIDGKFIFYLVDSVGLPLDIINEELRESGIGFDVEGFIRAAKKSTNYTIKRLKNLFNSEIDNKSEELKSLIIYTINKVYLEEL